jgi:hypothetical protein
LTRNPLFPILRSSERNFHILRAGGIKLMKIDGFDRVLMAVKNLGAASKLFSDLLGGKGPSIGRQPHNRRAGRGIFPPKGLAWGYDCTL